MAILMPEESDRFNFIGPSSLFAKLILLKAFEDGDIKAGSSYYNGYVKLNVFAYGKEATTFVYRTSDQLTPVSLVNILKNHRKSPSR